MHEVVIYTFYNERANFRFLQERHENPEQLEPLRGAGAVGRFSGFAVLHGNGRRPRIRIPGQLKLNVTSWAVTV